MKINEKVKKINKRIRNSKFARSRNTKTKENRKEYHKKVSSIKKQKQQPQTKSPKVC